MLDRSTISRSGHTHVCREMAHDAEHLARARRWACYRAAFAHCLRFARGTAEEPIRQVRCNAALAALEDIEADAESAPTPRNVTARAPRAFADTMPLTSPGHEQRRTLTAEADDLAQAARCSRIPAIQNHAHAAHRHAPTPSFVPARVPEPEVRHSVGIVSALMWPSVEGWRRPSASRFVLLVDPMLVDIRYPPLPPLLSYGVFTTRLVLANVGARLRLAAAKRPQHGSQVISQMLGTYA